jgi:cysteine sulfinate desulfinase/cysteine desulfurase-like protein
MQRTRFEAAETAVLRRCRDLAKRGCTVTFLGVDQHGNLGAATTATASRENKIVTAALRLRSLTLKSAQKRAELHLKPKRTIRVMYE